MSAAPLTSAEMRRAFGRGFMCGLARAGCVLVAPVLYLAAAFAYFVGEMVDPGGVTWAEEARAVRETLSAAWNHYPLTLPGGPDA